MAAILRYWNGCPKWYPQQRKAVVAFKKTKQGKRKLTRDLLYAQTLERRKAILETRFELVQCWEHDFQGVRFIYLPCKISRRCWERTNTCRPRKTCGSKANTCLCLSRWQTLTEQRARTHIQQRSGRACPELLGVARAKLCRHPRRQAAIHPGRFRLPALNGNQPFQRCGVAAGCLDGISHAEHTEPKDTPWSCTPQARRPT